MIRRIALLLSLAMCLAGCGQNQAEQEKKAVDAILKLGGRVSRTPGFHVDLRGTKITDAGLKDLKQALPKTLISCP